MTDPTTVIFNPRHKVHVYVFCRLPVGAEIGTDLGTDGVDEGPIATNPSSATTCVQTIYEFTEFGVKHT